MKINFKLTSILFVIIMIYGCAGVAIPENVKPNINLQGTATARCNDGTTSYSKNCSGTCSGHGGVAVWYTDCGD